MHKALHPRDHIDRQKVSRKEGRGPARIQDSFDTSIRKLADYIRKSKERLITVTRNHTNNTRNNRTTINRKQK